MSTSPVFVGTPKIWQGQVSAANTNRDGTGTIVTILTAGASGSVVKRVRMVAAVAVTNGILRLFLHDGTNSRLIWEELVISTTPSATVAVWSAIKDFLDGLVLPAGWSLRASTHNAEAINVIVEGGDF